MRNAKNGGPQKGEMVARGRLEETGEKLLVSSGQKDIAASNMREEDRQASFQRLTGRYEGLARQSDTTSFQSNVTPGQLACVL